MLSTARESLVAAADGRRLRLDLEVYSPALREERACFVTLLTMPEEALRGCTGTLVARQPLIAEVAHTAANTALYDPRFPAVVPEEVPGILIEISILTPSEPLGYDDAGDLLDLLRPGVDGVTLIYEGQRGTLLPQVWERIPDTVEFLGALCHKMGFPRDFWQSGQMKVEIYQAVELVEPH